MKTNDVQEAMRNLDKDIIDEARKNRKNRKIKKITVITSCVSCLLVVAIVAGIFGGRAISDNNKKGNGAHSKENSSAESSDKIKYSEVPGVFSRKTAGEGFELYTESSVGKSTYSIPIPAGYDHSIRDFEDIVIDESNSMVQAGTLTACEWKDRNYFDNWKKIVNDNDWYEYASKRLLFSNNMVKVSVMNGDKGCFNSTVKLLEGKNVLYSAKTDANGNAYLFFNITENEKNAPDAVEVNGEKYEMNGSNEITVQLDDSTEISKLDLMFMVDTTGSMGDELDYLRTEMKDIVSKIERNNQLYSLRLSMNFYRDTTDEYIVDSHPFSSDIEESQRILNNAGYNGGGDYPEAVDAALDDAINKHEWEQDSVKICFLILDAPPHSDTQISDSIRNNIIAAAEKGIRIIPVLCSGADQETEYLCRSYALMTGGSFLFLTNDSGVGGSHITPTDVDSDVEKLNDCIVRVVNEYCGYTETK